MKNLLTNWNKRTLFMICMALLLTGIGIFIIFSGEIVQGDFWVIATCIINILLFLVQLLRSIWQRPFSFDMMFWLFSLFFFGYAPLLQHLTNVYAWDLEPTASQVLKTNLLILLWSVCYLLGRGQLLGEKLQKALLRIAKGTVSLTKKLVCAVSRSWLAAAWKKCVEFLAKLAKQALSLVVRGCKAIVYWVEDHTPLKLERLARKCASGVRTLWQREKRLSPRMRAMDGLLVISLLIVVYYLVNIGFSNLFARATAEIPTSNTMVYLLLTHGFKNTLLFTAVLFLLRLKSSKRFDFRAALAAGALLLCCFPTAMSRNMMASFYAGLMIIAIDKTRKGRWFSLVILCGLILVFPAADVFRYGVMHSAQEFMAVLRASFQNTYLGGHYDAHQMFISVQNYVSEFGITWGNQLLGALLFFVPRKIWPTKALGTGHTVITALEQFSFTNVSAPLVAEGYVNFGILGVAVFAVILGAAVKLVDTRYWKNRRQMSLIRILYPFSMFQFFFLLRGDMLSGWAYLVAQIAVGAVIYLLVIHRTRSKT